MESTLSSTLSTKKAFPLAPSPILLISLYFFLSDSIKRLKKSYLYYLRIPKNEQNIVYN